MKVVTWNLKWARPGSRRERIVNQILCDSVADLICLTEAFPDTCPPGGMIIQASKGNLVADRMGAKKVLLWSRNRWRDVSVEDHFVPPGRIVTGVADTVLGPIRVLGVCIPWPASNTPRFGGTRRLWEDHLSFLDALKFKLGTVRETTLLIGDFNQRLPRDKQPRKVAEALEDVVSNLVVGTRAFVSKDGCQPIDHIAHTPDICLSEVAELPRQHGDVEVSDHFGVSALIRRA